MTGPRSNDPDDGENAGSPRQVEDGVDVTDPLDSFEKDAAFTESGGDEDADDGDEVDKAQQRRQLPAPTPSADFNPATCRCVIWMPRDYI